MKSLTTLIALSVALFTEDKSLKQVFAAEDGNIFLDENRAKLHADGKKIKYHQISRLDALKNEASVNDNDDNEAEKAELVEEYKTLFEGKTPHHMIGIEKLKAKIDEKKAENAKQNNPV
jgi:hypothetical protein